MIFYYDNESNVYTNQWDALASGKKCRLYYYDDIFNSVDWTIEPPETLNELYKIRAQEIRDTYDHVILCYSGGHDSTNILEVFYYNNIHVDEIVLVGSFSQDSYTGSDENHNAEIHKNCFPTLNGFNLPNTKITVVDYAKLFNDPMNFSLIRKYGNEWIKHVGICRSIGHLFWYDFKDFVGAKNDKKTCYVMGIDKLNYSRGTFLFNDLSLFAYGGVYKSDNFDRVNFYTSPETNAMNIMRKQAHILNYVKTVDCYAKNWENEYEKVIYNLRNPIIHESPKSISSSISVRDMFMFRTNESDMHKMFKEGLRLLSKVTSIESKPIYFTRPYYVEKR